MIEPKRISTDGAVARAERYRMLNEPEEAESICREALQVEPDNQHLWVALLLAIADQFEQSCEIGLGDATRVLEKIGATGDRAYYGGLIAERWAKALLRRGVHPSVASSFFQEAMDLYSTAIAAGCTDGDAFLRSSTCARLMQRSAVPAADADEAAAEAGFPDGAPAV
jgi:tetratricopeptide (TPR) repeat protein